VRSNVSTHRIWPGNSARFTKKMKRIYLKEVERFIIFKDDIRVFSLGLLIFQSIGIRFFEGQGWLLSFVLIGLNFNSFFTLKKKDLFVLLAAFVFLVFNWSLNRSFGLVSLFFQYFLILNAYLLLLNYRGSTSEFERDLYFCVKAFVIHAAIGYFLYLIVPAGFNIAVGLNKSLLGLFYVSNSSFAGLIRNTGVFWEPGVYQLVANLFLFFTIKLNKSIFAVFFGFLTVVISFSTLGLFVMIFNILYFLFTRIGLNIRNLAAISLGGVLFLLFVGPILISNVSDKVADTNTSGLARLRDLMIGIELIKERPILGHGKFESSEYLIEKAYVNKIESELFSTDYLDIHGEMSGGLTNGFLALFAWYGLPIGFFLFYCFFKQRLLKGNRIESIIFVLIPTVSFFSEPITYTSFFLIFPFSFLIFRNGEN